MLNLNKMFLNLVVALNVAYITACFAIHLHFSATNFFLNYHTLIKRITILYYYNNADSYTNLGIDVGVYACVAFLASFCIGWKLLRTESFSNNLVLANKANTGLSIDGISDNDNVSNLDQSSSPIDFAKIFAGWGENIVILSNRENMAVVESAQLSGWIIVAIENDSRNTLFGPKSNSEHNCQKANIYIGDNSCGRDVLEQIFHMASDSQDCRLLVILDGLDVLGNVSIIDQECIFLSTGEIEAYLVLIANGISSLRYIQQQIIIFDVITKRMFYPLFGLTVSGERN